MQNTLIRKIGSGLPAALWVFVASAGESHITLSINPVWRFQLGEPAGKPWAPEYDDKAWDIVSLPHSHQLLCANLTDFREHGREAGWYRRSLYVPGEWRGKRLFLEFQGAMQATTLWVNGTRAGEHATSGFDSFHFDITQLVHPGTNVLAVQVDNRHSADVPPDGHEVDYILFGGLYRDVLVHVTDPMHVTFPWEDRNAGVRFTLPKVSEAEAVVQVETTVRNESPQPRQCTLVTELRDRVGQAVATMRQEHEIPVDGHYTFTQQSVPVPKPHLWSPDDPYLYHLLTIVRDGDSELDRVQTPVGVRWVKFDHQKGFFLNGKHLKLVGANRHQTWPFIGGAVPNGLQRREAEQMKAMGVSWVRLSHYPQDPEFLDALDELGLMALAEPPTWMDKGNAKWMSNLEASFRSMIRRDRNHPCIILWAACINHRPADPALVRAAMEEDPTRDRGQDTVQIPMAFTRLVVPGHGALATEHTGHTFPAQRGARKVVFRPANSPRGTVETSLDREFEQAERHWQQLNAAYLQEDNAGLAVWCMYDYNTFHNINEPGMVWHGVCDLFRIPKYSFYWHQSELTPSPRAYVVRVGPVKAVVFSNCEKVRLWEDSGQGYQQSATQQPDAGFTAPDGTRVNFALHHPPFSFTVSPNAKALKAEGLAGSAVAAAFEWKEAGAPVALTLEADRPAITADGADLSRIIVTAVDTNGTPVDTCTAPVTFSLQGLGQLIGENPVKLRAGKMIILVQSGFVPADLTVTATAPGLRPATAVVKTTQAPPNVDFPKDLAAKQPSPACMFSPQPSPLALRRPAPATQPK